MYGNCIFCSAPLGANEIVESFPIGSQIAFDPWKGRLWAICPRCSRWNLAPIEERWEPVEQAEKRFRATSLRAQSENIGLAYLGDGTRLIRVGQALPGELAAWRYGTRLLQRRGRYLAAGTATVMTVAAAVASPIATVGTIVVGTMSGGLFSSALLRLFPQRIVYQVSPPAPGALPMMLYPWHVEGMAVHLENGVDPTVLVRDAHLKVPATFDRDALVNHGFLVWRWGVRRSSPDLVTVSGDSAYGLLRRAMIHVNGMGATRRILERATGLLGTSASAERFLRDTMASGFALGDRAGKEPATLPGPAALAFEMALNDESERRALEGEIGDLEAAWREAETIAQIADSLPDVRRIPGDASQDS